MDVNVYALSKSGHNAITEWILSQTGEGFKCGVGHFDLNRADDALFVTKDSFGMTKEDFAAANDHVSIFENVDFQKVSVKSDVSILIIRDFLNCLASFFKFTEASIHKHLRSIEFGNLWEKYWEEFSGETNHLGENTIFISYNEWVRSPSYRLRVGMELKKAGLPITPTSEPYLKVTTKGYGSSFDGMKYKNSPEKMEVFDRYKSFLENDYYMDYIKYFEKNLKATKEYFNISLPEQKPKKNAGLEFSEEHFQSFFD